VEKEIKEYLDDCARRGFAATTLYSYRKALEKFFNWVGRHYPGIRHISEINRSIVTEYQMHLYKSSSRWGKPLSAETQHRWLGVVLWFFRWMVAEQKLLLDPTSAIRLPRRPQRITRNYLSLKEVQKLLRIPDVCTDGGLRDRAILEILYCCGLRNSELRKLAVSDLNLSDGWLVVREGKGNKDRVVPLGKAAVYFLMLYLEKVRSRWIRNRKTDIVFLNRLGRPLSYDLLIAMVKKTARLAGIKRTITPHGLRHTCATLMLRGHADIRHIQELLGHASLSSTQIYTRVEITDLKKVHAKCHPREKEPIQKK